MPNKQQPVITKRSPLSGRIYVVTRYQELDGGGIKVVGNHKYDVTEQIDSLLASAAEQPIPMVLHCPECHLQHIDVDDETGNWATDRLHRKHLCKPADGGCGHVWMPALVHTVGVEKLEP